MVELSRFRADLGRGRRARRADALLSAPDPRKAVRALPGDEFYYVVHEMGFPDAVEIIQYATAEQVQTALDFGLWDRDLIDPAAAERWLEALAECAPSAIGQWLTGIDVELFALLLRRRTRLYDLSQEEAPDEPEGSLYTTPDRLFTLDVLGDETEQSVTLQLLDALYRYDKDWARRVLVGTRGELDSELEEQAFRWRSGRMADLGFEDYYAALEVYREIDPGSVEISDRPAARVAPHNEPEGPSYLRLPAALVDRLASGSPFARAVAGIQDADELANLNAALVVLSNRVLAADRVTPGDDEAVSAVLTRLSCTLDLAVEFLSRGSPERATQAVRSVALTRLFQLGVSVIGKVRKLGRAVLVLGVLPAGGPRATLFRTEDQEVLEAASALRPMLSRVLEDPPAPGRRPFATLADVALATAAIERVGTALALLRAHGLDPGGADATWLRAQGIEDPAQVDTEILARTALARSLLGLGAPPFGPLSESAYKKLKKTLKDASSSIENTKELAKGLLAFALRGETVSGRPEVARGVAARWVEGLLSGEPLLCHTIAP